MLRAVRLRALADAPAAFTEPYDVAAAIPEQEWERRVARSLAGEALQLVAVDDDGSFAGMATGIQWDGRARVVGVWVAPDHRGGGTGSALVEAIAVWAATAGVDCQIEAAPGNDRARALYERLGFVAVDEVPPEGCDVVLVRRA